MNKNKKPHKYHPDNERAKYRYRQHLRGVGQKDIKTIISCLKHIREYEIFMDFVGFEKFNRHFSGKYVQWLFNQNYSLSFISDNIRALKDFLAWLERQRGYRSKIQYNDIDYLNISHNQRKTAKAKEYQKSYSYKKIIQTIRHMPCETLLQKRNRAIISLQAVCTLRISELRTVKIKNIIQEDGVYFVHVCPKSMEVKFAKTRHVIFIPLPDDIMANIIEWRNYLLSIGFSNADPLFPKVDSKFGKTNMLETKISKEGIRSNTTIRDIFQTAFTKAGFDYIRPHSFRATLARYAQTQSPAFYNAVRQNLGHESIDTTMNSYGNLSVMDQMKIISGNNHFK